MRLLERDDAGGFRLTKSLPSDAIAQIPPYAILSHTWADEEVLFGDLVDGTAWKKAGYSKIQFCGDQAWRDGLKYFWVDTCCIDKSDAVELQHALNSMFRWYRGAARCYVYLLDVSAHKRDADGNPSWNLAFRQSRWFTRGWTLQELIAPSTVEFFSREGERLGDKRSLEQEIRTITGIPQKALRGSPLSDFSIAERMRWIEKRNTKYEEDKVYSLFGIFDMHIPVFYGEGEQKALKRLRDKAHEDYLCLAKLWSTDPRDPRHEKERIELAKGGLLADAYRWVIDNPDFNRWRQLPECRLLWIKGDPGKGKTMLLCGIINELEGPITVGGGNLVYFFCQATEPRINNATAVLRGLIYLLVQRQPRLLLHLPENTYASDDAMAWVVLSKALLEMLDDSNLNVTYLVIDALDECVIDQPKLLSLVAQISSITTRVKCVVSSRNWVQIEEQLAIVAQQSRLSLELNAESVTNAVNIFIRHKVMHLSQVKQYDSTTENAVHDYLSSNADGTFLWVALACKALADPKVRKRHSLTVLRTFPPGLDSLYGRMMDNIDYSEDADLCKQILAVATIVRRPISLQELSTLIEMPDSISCDPQSVEELIGLCGSFLFIREQTVYFIHQSAKDFLLGIATHQSSREAFNRVFPLGMGAVNRTIFSRSLSTMWTILRRDMYGLRQPGFPIDQVRVPEPDPLATVRYSCVYWADHLSKSGTNANLDISPQDSGAVYTFLKTKYLYWLEALSLLRAVSDGIMAIRQLQDLLGLALSSQLRIFVSDACRFAQYHKVTIERWPLQVYASALVFSPMHSIIRNWFQREEPEWISKNPIVEEDWNACLQTLEGDQRGATSAAWSEDAAWVAAACGNAIKIWHAVTGQCISTLYGHTEYITSVAWSQDSSRLASASNDCTIRLWHTASNTCTSTLQGHAEEVSVVAWSHDAARLLSASHDGTLKIWSGVTGQCVRTLEGHGDSVSSATWLHDTKVASGSWDGTIKIWDTTTGQCISTIEDHLSDGIYTVAWAYNTSRLASGSSDNNVRLWDLMTGRCISTLKGHAGAVCSVAWSFDEARLASASDDKTVRVWDIISRQCLLTLEGHSHGVLSVDWSRHSSLLVSASEDGRVKIWDTVPNQRPSVPGRHMDQVTSFAWSFNSAYLASTSDDSTIRIWETATGTCILTLDGHTHYVTSVQWQHNSMRLASASGDKTIKIWDTETGESLLTLEGHRDSVSSVAWSTTSARLASGSSDHTIKIWETSGQCISTFEGHTNSVDSVSWLRDTTRLASASQDQTVKIWDTATGQCLSTLSGHRGWVGSVVWSHNAAWLASVSWDCTLRIWDVVTSQCMLTYNIGREPRHIEFDKAVPYYLHTDYGTFDVRSSLTSIRPIVALANSAASSIRPMGYGMIANSDWITYNRQKLLRLPSGYEPSILAVSGSTVAVGCYSGRVLILGVRGSSLLLK